MAKTSNDLQRYEVRNALMAMPKELMNKEIQPTTKKSSWTWAAAPTGSSKARTSFAVVDPSRSIAPRIYSDGERIRRKHATSSTSQGGVNHCSDPGNTLFRARWRASNKTNYDQRAHSNGMMKDDGIRPWLLSFLYTKGPEKIVVVPGEWIFVNRPRRMNHNVYDQIDYGGRCNVLSSVRCRWATTLIVFVT